LEFFVFQQGLTASNVLGFGFFGRGAGADQKRGGEQDDEQKKGVGVSAALSIFHHSGSP
jgi:hypothetical protein